MDFYLETEEKKIYVEVKGVTLEEDGVVLFPDAPTQRGVRHLEELEKWMGQGRESVLLLVIQMKGVRYFTPNRKTHPAFADALTEAVRNGVEVLAVNCLVREDELRIHQPIPVRL